MVKDLLILAYSGGLDTSCILKWLVDKGYDVICYVADLGQDDDFNTAKSKALAIGAKEVIIEDLKVDFIKNYAFPAIQMGLIYESRYLLGTSLARPCISLGLIKAAKEKNAKFIAHGATGKGNDQLRFELTIMFQWPDGKVLAPWRDREFYEKFGGRTDLIEYAQKHDIPVPVSNKQPWSMDANIWHVSYEAGDLEDPSISPPDELYTMTVNPQDSPECPVSIEITFEHGLPVAVKVPARKEWPAIVTNPLEIVKVLNRLGSEHCIGRIDIVENRALGLKSRGIYECPAGTILYLAHLDLEVYSLDKEVLRVKKILQDRMSDLAYFGYWFSPEGDYTRQCIILSQANVTGTVFVKLYKGTAYITGRKSNVSLYNQQLVSMDEQGGFSAEDTTGFINISGLRLKEYARVANENDKTNLGN